MKARTGLALPFRIASPVALCLAAAAVASLPPGAMDSCDCLPFQAAYASGHSATTIAVGANSASITAAISALQDGAVLTFATGTHTNIGQIVVSKPMTITGQVGAAISGNSALVADSSGVTIRNLTFDQITGSGTAGAVQVGGQGSDLSDIAVSENTITRTAGTGVLINDSGGRDFANISIANNTFREIGSLSAGAAYSAVATARQGGTATDLFIIGNTVETTTGGGIDLGDLGVVNGHVGDNSISDVPASGVLKAAGRDQALQNQRLAIHGNVITGANNDRAQDSAHEAAVTVWGGTSASVRVSNNTITDSYNGILVCAGDCAAGSFQPAAGAAGQPIFVLRNALTGNSGFDLANLAPGQVQAQFNYWGPDGPVLNRTSGSVDYSPYYSNAILTVLGGAAPQQSSAASRPACSISVGDPVTFRIATGGESAAVAQTITNAGTEAVEGIRVTVDAWVDADGAEYGTLLTSVRVGGEFVDVDPGAFVPVGVSLQAGQSASVELKVEHNGRLLPAGDSLSQEMRFLAGCR